MARLSIILMCAWLAAWGPSVRWVLAGWSTGDGLLQGAIALGLLVLGLRSPPTLRLQPTGPVLLAAVAAPVLGALLHQTLPLDVIGAAAAVISAWSLLGLYLPATTWRRSAPALLLALLLLPVTAHLDVLLGWPLRKLTASAAALALSTVSEPVAMETVLRVEGGIAHVDLPCAGVRSLWSGAVLLLGGTVALRRRIGPTWLLAACLGGISLVIGNIARVTALVALDHVLAWRLVAEILHVPLGLASFALAGGITLAGLAFAPAWEPVSVEEPPTRSGGLVAALVLPALVFAACLDLPGRHEPAPRVALPGGFDILEPSEAELAFVSEHGGSIVKGRFHGGTVALVAARSWIAHHVPEMCLEAAGWRLTEDHPALLDGLPARVAQASREGRQATALWWLQSDTTLTDDHLVRIRDGLDPTAARRPWVLVSVLLDGEVQPDDPAVLERVHALRRAVAAALESP